MPVFDYLAQHPEEASDQGAPGFGLRFVNWINPRRRLPSIRSWIPRPVRISWTAAKQPTMHLRGNGSYAAIRRRLPLLPNSLVSELKVDFNGGRGALPDNLADTCIRCRCHLPAHKHEWKKDRTMNAQQLDLRVRNLDCEHLPPRYPDRSV